MPEKSNGDASAATPFSIADHLPFRLIKSEIIPPVPNLPDPNAGSVSAIDWIPDFAGYAWVAYGASSLLVISHLPNPLSETEPQIGPISRQVLELSADGTGTVSAVSWSPVMPSSGDLAAALDNCIGLFSFNPNTSSSSFCWSQTAILAQAAKVETIKWTSSGDGIISGGVEVVLWRKKEMTWEIAWKFKPELPQMLVSASWTIAGPFATAPLSNLHVGDTSSLISEASRCVLVCYGAGDSKYHQVELRHPMPVSMIQWRPTTGKQQNIDSVRLPKLVLLTCCLDGAVRLWCEVDDVRIRRAGKDTADHKMTRSSFRVVAVVEVNQQLSGILGSDINVRWAAEFDAIVTIAKKANHYSCSDDYLHDKAGRCEWLIGYGRDDKLTLWAIHCLDDFAPLRFPRVTLWKTQALACSEVVSSKLLLDKAFIMRNQLSGPPKLCSLLKLVSCNSFSWVLYSPASTILPDRTDNLLPSPTKVDINVDGNTGKILQIVLHPYLRDVEVAASLESNGTVLLWSLSNFSQSIIGMPTLNPSWKCSGKLNSSYSSLKYSSLTWTPAVLDENSVLSLGHTGGIDCVVIKNLKNENEPILHHTLCTIPFASHLQGQAPTGIWTIPLPSTCDKAFVSISFLLVAVWKNGFHALSWKITIHNSVSPENDCSCDFEIRNGTEGKGYAFEGSFSGRNYCISVQPCSSEFPAPHKGDVVSSFAVLYPNNSTSYEEHSWNSANELYSSCPAYHMVTGCADGSLKLWRSIPAEISSLNSQWDLVGMLAAHQGPVLRISPTVSGRKIATVTSPDPSNSTSTLLIWECVNLAVAGGFILEDTLYFDGEIVASNWLMMGNGQWLLGVCLQNELHIYTQRHSQVLNTLQSEKSLQGSTWFCIAVSHTCSSINDFFWGPKAMPIVVHGDYFCLFSDFLFFGNKKKLCSEDRPNFPILDSSMKDDGGECVSGSFKKMNVNDDIVSIMNSESPKKQSSTGYKCLWSLNEVVEQLGGFLSIFHPQALLMNICSGNWKRAYVVLQHISEHLMSNYAFAREHCSRKSNCLIPSVALSKYFDGASTAKMSESSSQWSTDVCFPSTSSQLEKGLPQNSSTWDVSASNVFHVSSSKNSEISDFINCLEKLFEAAVVTHLEKLQMHAIIDLLQEISNQQISSPYGSLDEAGQRFWASVKFQWFYFTHKCDRSPTVEELVVPSRLIGWAYLSDCQDNLFNSLLSSEPSWEEMRNIGFGYWYTNAAQLRVKMEKLARQQYMKSKDPKACALLYIALNRIQVLAGLFKISKNEKDKPWVGFLSRNFQEDKNKAAAIKNAYVLMGKHQLELAVAFFLLGGDTTSAVTVCAKNLGDAQLALVICRLVDGYGGPLERNLVSKSLLPSAHDNGDYWLASLLELMVGNHLQVFLRMLGLPVEPSTNKSDLSFSQASFLDPSIGQYCLKLATKTSVKNAIGEQNASIFGRWSVLMTTTALSRCGLPLDALECLSSSLSIFGGLTQRSMPEIAGSIIDILKPLPCTSPSNWISDKVALKIEFQSKSDLAAQYIATLFREHPSWLDTNILSYSYDEPKSEELGIYLSNFQDRLRSALSYFHQKFSIIPLDLVNKMILYSFNNGLQSIGCYILHLVVTDYFPSEKDDGSDLFFLHPVQHKLLLKISKEVSCMILRYILVCCINCSGMKSWTLSNLVGEEGFCFPSAWEFYRWSLIWSLRLLRATLKMFSVSSNSELQTLPSNILDVYEYYVYFAAAWSQRNFKVLILIIQPLLRCVQEDAAMKTELGDWNGILCEVAQMLAHDSSAIDGGPSIQMNEHFEHEQGANIWSSVPKDERWQFMTASLWVCMSTFLKNQLYSLLGKLEGACSFQHPGEVSFLSTSYTYEPSARELDVSLISALLCKSLDVTFAHMCLHSAKQFVSFLLWKTDVSSETILLCSNDHRFLTTAEQGEFIQGVSSSAQSTDVMGYQKQSAAETLWNVCVNPKFISKGFVQETSEVVKFIKQKSFRCWSDTYAKIKGENETEDFINREDSHGSPSKVVRSPRACLSPNDHPFLSSCSKDTSDTKKYSPFHNPREIYKRNGELFEALCINSIDQKEVALASNRKGLVFFKYEDRVTSGGETEYIWLEADWPLNGWAGSNSTPIPTCVSPGVGLGSKKGTHLGLGGATVGAGSQVRQGRDIMGGGAGGPNYSGLRTSDLGWGFEGEFDESVDPPATMENVRTRALAAHPLRPLLLVGSSNTHIYLWEFSKGRATATYGVLPAANVPPPYALASISAVRFDCCGHRFVTGALDGTVCTWQLEVGGRSNIRPTESSICFNNHTSDVSYVTPSGSIVAAAGHSSNGINVVVWDTLAPPATSRASIMCHEGGARSLAVFDNNFGSGSVSPLIVTGGRDGDVGIHDFRYIATGRTKRHKHHDGAEQNSQASPTVAMQSKTGDQNRNGMLWYIPKAHSGSVTKISTIPNTSFFLTGSKDGDVKLWDAKQARLVFHWPKLHERHTFLQPSSRGFGGVARAAVTDIQVISSGFLSCGGDGSVKMIELKDFSF